MQTTVESGRLSPGPRGPVSCMFSVSPSCTANCNEGLIIELIYKHDEDVNITLRSDEAMRSQKTCRTPDFLQSFSVLLLRGRQNCTLDRTNTETVIHTHVNVKHVYQSLPLGRGQYVASTERSSTDLKNANLIE